MIVDIKYIYLIDFQLIYRLFLAFFWHLNDVDAGIYASNHPDLLI